MKFRKKALCALLAFAVIICMPIEAFAIVRNKATDNYGTLSGSITQSGTVLNTTTMVTENNHGGTLYTKIKVTDAIDTTISSSTYRSLPRDLTLVNSTQMRTIIRSVVVPGYAAYTPEIRGGSEVGDFFTISFLVDSSAFN